MIRMLLTRWLTGRSSLPRQEMYLQRHARVLVEADYHMKLIGMGLVDGVPGVESYLDSIRLAPGEAPPPLGVLRWWFALNYSSIQATPRRDAFQLKGSGVKVQSENELLGQQGQRIHTGKSEELNQRFAASFTQHFAVLAAAYPVYAELRNVFDLAMVAALIRHEDLASRTDWSAAYFRDAQACQVELSAEPKEVESVVNHRLDRPPAFRGGCQWRSPRGRVGHAGSRGSPGRSIRRVAQRSSGVGGPRRFAARSVVVGLMAAATRRDHVFMSSRSMAVTCQRRP